MDWDKLKIFHAVAEAGNFTKATYVLNLSQSAISRQIQSLEQELKTQLFERHARGLSLTENGEYLFKTAHEVISKLKDVESTLMDKKDKPSGKITITTVRSFGTHWLTPRIEEFMQLNPEIEVELIFDDKELDLSTREADIGIWMRRPRQLNYIRRKLMDSNYHVYGSTKYLEKKDKILGEITVIISASDPKQSTVISDQQILDSVKDLEIQKLGISSVSKLIAEKHQVSRRRVYQLIIENKR